MASKDPVAGAALLRQLRESRGWSWADLARALRETAARLSLASVRNTRPASIQRTVARWESPTAPTSPGERYQFLLGHLYARSATGALALGTGSDWTLFVDALRHFGVTEHRIGHLSEMVTRSSDLDDTDALTQALVGGQLPAAPEEGVVRRLAHEVASINSQVGSTPLVRLQLRLAPVINLCQRMVQSTRREDVLLLAKGSFALAGRLAFETRDDETAESLYRDAAKAAGRLPDHRHRAAVHTSHAMVALHRSNDLDTASKLSRAAVAEAHRSDSYALRARAHAVYAEVSARTGQPDRASTALARAWRTIEQLQHDQQPCGFDADRLDGFDGLCALYAGNVHRANDRLERSLTTLTKPRDAVQRGIVSTDLALARLRIGDPAASLVLLHDAVDLAAATGGRVPIQRLRHARRALRHSRAETYLAELDEHLHDVLMR
ncbi:hypothetical protein GCM10025787_29700 [Saccharopolyspora rosea]|uniref:Transcriptional regulator n=1 Tax=Saccharopolyspora rosea TaxID=524884 RepID=A0ABW3G2Z2_9PSEU